MIPRASRALESWRWYYHAAIAEMGIRSSWEPLVQMAQTGGAQAHKQHDKSYTAKALSAARRHARIEARLARVDAATLVLIRALARDPQDPWLQAYGEAGALAPFCEAARYAHRASRSRKDVRAWLVRLGGKLARGRASPEERRAIEKIRDGVEEALAQIAREYDAA